MKNVKKLKNIKCLYLYENYGNLNDIISILLKFFICQNVSTKKETKNYNAFIFIKDFYVKFWT